MLEPSVPFEPQTHDELARILADNATTVRRCLAPIGGGTCRHATGQETIDVRLHRLNRVIDYPARDMTITVEAGIRMADLVNILRAEKQRLAIDVPQAEQATLGGVIATNWSGPRRFGCGTMRDYVIGISAIDAGGRLFKAGGRVVKNVAGYDLCKLLVGSFGTLAIITQVTLKLRPIPESSALVLMSFDSLKQIDTVLNRLLTSATRPVALDVLNVPAAKVVRPDVSTDDRPVLCVGFEGSEREVNWQTETVTAECRPFEPRQIESLIGTSADALWASLRDFAIAGPHGSFRVSRRSSETLDLLRRATEDDIPAQAHAGNGIVIGYRPSAGVKTDDWSNKPIDDRATEWMRRIKRQLDPFQLLNPGAVVW